MREHQLYKVPIQSTHLRHTQNMLENKKKHFFLQNASERVERVNAESIKLFLISAQLFREIHPMRTICNL